MNKWHVIYVYEHENWVHKDFVNKKEAEEFISEIDWDDLGVDLIAIIEGHSYSASPEEKVTTYKLVPGETKTLCKI